MPYKQVQIPLEEIQAYTASLLLLGQGGPSGSKLDFEKEKQMNHNFKSTLALGLIATTAVLAAASAHAEIHSKSKNLVVMEARDLPERAQTPGNSLFLHADNGSTYLYVEQQQGARLSVFDVTDPAHIKLVMSTPLAAQGAFDFVRPLGDYAELVDFRNSQKQAVLDLRKAKSPVLRMVPTMTDLGAAEPLGETGFLVRTEAHVYTPAVAHDYQVIDVTASIPTQLATVKDVKHRVTNDETGTTFLLGSDGLTVVRRPRVEQEYQAEQRQTEGN
jgi:hypothetical protein